MSTIMPTAVKNTAWTPIVRAIPPPPPASTRVEGYMRIVENGWREIGEIARGTSKRRIEDVQEEVSLSITDLFRTSHSKISYEESAQILLFLAKLPAFLAAEEIKQKAEQCFSRWSDFYQMLHYSYCSAIL